MNRMIVILIPGQLQVTKVKNLDSSLAFGTLRGAPKGIAPHQSENLHGNYPFISQ
jgi:hypothetical protein